MAPRVLVVDDDSDLVDVVCAALQREGYRFGSAHDGAQALKVFDAQPFDIVLLDVNLPTISGFEVARYIRRRSRIPIIILTGRDTDDDVVDGFSVGADDYVVKPVSLKRLLVRVRAQLRRAHAAGVQNVERPITWRDITLDRETREVRRADRPVRLTKLEFEILYMLMVNPGKVASYSRLVQHAWGYRDLAGINLLKSHISHIRQKLGIDSATLRSNGAGYCLSEIEALEPVQFAYGMSTIGSP